MTPRRLGPILVALFAMIGAAVIAAPIAPDEHRRGEEQTFLTFPEWYLVFSPAEYADYVAGEPPSGFPFGGHVRQFWSSYARVADATKARRYPPNAEYHVMIATIGVSTTVEYGLRGAYETVIGRVAEATTTERTDEDAYAARVAADYVAFIRERPWYEFDFTSRLKALWTEVPLGGAGLLRKLERRYALTNEYILKAGYAKVIERATRASFERPSPLTHVVYRSVDGSVATDYLPRYEAFTPASIALAGQGADFVEIAGNGAEAAVLVSVLAAQDWAPAGPAEVLFEQPVLTEPGRKRVAVVVRVDGLAGFLRTLDDGSVVAEHVFDY
jgi:hypothetical protein